MVYLDIFILNFLLKKQILFDDNNDGILNVSRHLFIWKKVRKCYLLINVWPNFFLVCFFHFPTFFLFFVVIVLFFGDKHWKLYMIVSTPQTFCLTENKFEKRERDNWKILSHLWTSSSTSWYRHVFVRCCCHVFFSHFFYRT